ncbi:MAG: conjugal transfer protein [Mesorhizobium sp.]|uniref:TrbG/VirB9 family P-type conjugative transfer protein n=1 Tax=Mesorhizobium sp. TaxID=1871066 RepID=UPI001206CF38|nr:TrbG/VirB9 family P-type conjugative transfer protein [Mesorhizobium sp.]TIL22209.1 MAG: conjugal transfer protein [Mesorhizobium sp.]
MENAVFRILLLPIITAVALINPVMAEQSPVGFASDARIKRHVYDENNVYKLNLYLKSVTAIQFAEGENVESILIGDSASWEVVKLRMGNVVSLKPIIDQALTNMTIYTDQRVYMFELRSVGEVKAGMKTRADQAFRTVFTYPDRFKTLDKSRTGGPINHDYMVSGYAQFRPLAVRDNTLQTTFVLPKGAPRPAIFKVGHDREEKVANSRTDGNHIIVDGTSDYWVMRIGDDTVCVGKASAVHTAKPVRKGLRRAG